MFGGTPGPLRLLNSALGGQAGWLLGFAVVSGLGMLVASRLRRADARTRLAARGRRRVPRRPRSCSASASGIFHPYYVSLLAPFIAALVGRGRRPADRRRAAARGSSGRWRSRRASRPSSSSAATTRGSSSWLPAVLIVVGALAALALLGALRAHGARWSPSRSPPAALLLAPAVWAVDTLGYADQRHLPRRRAGLRGERRRRRAVRRLPRRRPRRSEPAVSPDCRCSARAAPGWRRGGPQRRGRRRLAGGRAARRRRPGRCRRARRRGRPGGPGGAAAARAGAFGADRHARSLKRCSPT